MQKFLDELNKEQHDAVVQTKGPSLVIAGAGAGKTRVLTFRIAYLLTQGIEARKILALTFTNKAAKEMKERIASLVGNESSNNLWMGTFHSVFARILRKEAENLGYQSNFSIYDSDDSKSILRKIIADLKLDKDTYKVNEVFSRISKAKNNLITPQVYANDPTFYERDIKARKPEISNIFIRYAKSCYKNNAMDFDDLLLNTNILLRDHPSILEKYQNYYDYILVDEYQDTNYAQYLILKKLAEQKRNICVVGDDAQSIYSFRGAKIENILNFKNDYPENNLFKLEQNYRSTQNILNTANSVIDKNQNQIKKHIWSDKQEGTKVKVVKAITDGEEGYLVTNSIIDIISNNQHFYSDFAILYRTNAQSRIIEEALRKRNIPYKIYGGLSFYQRKEIKDLLAYFRLTVNPNDNESLKRIINYPARSIGKTSFEKLEVQSEKTGLPIWSLLKNINNESYGIRPNTINKIKEFYNLISGYQHNFINTDAYNFAYDVAKSSGILKELYNEKTPESLSKYENIQELLNSIKDFIDNQLEEEGNTMVTIDQYIENVALITDQDTNKPEDKNKVSLMTIHAAKGLEFKNVFIVGVEEELFPSFMSIKSANDIEEERRLFYVAITRAMENLMISYANSRYKWGSLTNTSPSRFISDLNEEYIELPLDFMLKNNTHTPDSKTTFKSNQTLKHRTSVPKSDTSVIDSDFIADAPSKIQAGMKVQHQKFGEGKVLQLEGTFPDSKATVFFNNIGQKKLLLKFAKLKIIN